MDTVISSFSVPKDGSSDNEYEDAWAVTPAEADNKQYTGPSLAAAVADGASEALLAGLWANRLVTAFTTAPAEQDLTTTILTAAAEWDIVETEYRQRRDATGDPIAWYEEDGLRRGAFATIVGVHLSDGDNQRTLQAWALGDACLFQIRDDRIVHAFPVDDPGLFGTAPALAPSRPVNPDKIGQHVVTLRTAWEPGDLVLLVSDALAHWFLTQAAVGGAPWQRLRELDPAKPLGFYSLVDGCRSTGSLKNDDTTLVRIQLH